MKSDEGVEVIYSVTRWELLRNLRKRATEIMTSLDNRRLASSIFGSVSRGDVKPDSDIDIIIPQVVSSYSIELALSMGGFKIYSRKIAQATPSHALKAHIYLDTREKECVTFPLIALSPLEVEFYRFGGIMDLPSLKMNRRVLGCDKRLMLIQPTEKGHIELPIIGRELDIAKIMDISLDIVKERTRVLMRRREIGRTGIVILKHLNEDEVFEDALRKLAASNPIVKRRMRTRN